VLFLVLAILWGLAAATAGLTSVLPVWAALLAMAFTLFFFAFVLATVGVAYIRRGSNVVPEEALAEAQIIRDELQEELRDVGIT
jgi:ABC-type transport system involved in multi-copper enzyme maturation permease subunit